MKLAKLDDAAIAESLQSLNARTSTPWTIKDDKLRKIFQFEDFSEAFGFMARAALAVESMDHHPEWVNEYKTVDVGLTTHKVGGITELDFQLAARMDALAG